MVDPMTDDHDLPDDHHHDADAPDVPADHQSDHVWLDDHHHDEGAQDASRDPKIFRQKKVDPMTDDHDLPDDHRRDEDATDGQSQNCVNDLGDHHRGADGKVANHHDEGHALQMPWGDLNGLNHYLVLGDADRFCLV